MKRWITFDLDGTLMQNPFAGWIFPELEEIVSAELKSSHAFKRQLMDEHERLLSEEQIVAAYDWDEICGRLMGELGINRTVDILEMVNRHSVAPKIFLLDDTVLPTLERLKKNGYSLAAVTNGFYKYQYPVMKELGLTDWLDEIVTPDRVGCSKPDVRMADGLLREGKIAAHVGDRLDHDMVFARGLEVPGVLIHRGLPPSMKSLSPKERASCPELEPVLHELAANEKQREVFASLTEKFRPAYVIGELQELLECLDSSEDTP